MFRSISRSHDSRRAISVTLDGEATAAREGEPVAAILLRVPPFFSRITAIGGTPRAPFCMMGACFECLVEIDGQPSTRACLIPATDGMRIARQIGRPDPAGETAA